MRDLWKLYRELFRFNWLYFWHTLKKCWFVYFRSRKCHQIRQKQTTHEEAHTCHLWGMIKQFPFFLLFSILHENGAKNGMEKTTSVWKCTAASSLWMRMRKFSTMSTHETVRRSEKIITVSFMERKKGHTWANLMKSIDEECATSLECNTIFSDPENDED